MHKLQLSTILPELLLDGAGPRRTSRNQTSLRTKATAQVGRGGPDGSNRRPIGATNSNFL